MTTRKKRSPEERQYIPLDDPTQVFTSTDLGVSSALLSAGFELLSVDKENPRKALFTFHRSRNIEEQASLYFSDKLEVRARSFFDSIRALKNRLYSE